MEKKFMANSKPRILIAASIYPPDAGGPAIHAQKQYEGFLKEGYKTDLLALAFYRKLPRGIRHLFFLISLFKKALHADVIYAHDAWGVGFPSLLVSFVLNRKLIIRVGGDMAWERAAENNITALSMREWYENKLHKKSKFFYFSRLVLPYLDVLIVPSILLSDLYIKYYKVPVYKIHVISNPVPTNNIISDIKKDKTIIYASRLVAYKNLSFVLEVLGQIIPSNPDLKFIIMGDGPERKNLENLSWQLGINDNVVFTGSISQEEVLKKCASCLFGIAPALTEFNPNYILQCISYGKPFLISRENGFPFVVPSDFLFDPRSKNELEKSINYLLDENNYSKAVSGVKSLNFNMTWDDVLKENLSTINLLLNGQK